FFASAQDITFWPVEGHPAGAELLAFDWPEGDVLVPGSGDMTADRFYEELTVEEIHPLRKQELCGNSRRRRLVDEVAELVALLPEEEIAAEGLVPHGDGISVLRGVRHGLIHRSRHARDPILVEEAASENHAVAVVGLDLFGA
ncbi:MAG: hypothetical protein AAEJ52_17940, partial [Myxococcota bacterium]